MENEKPNVTITADEARTLIEQEEQRKDQACLAELQAVLQKYQRQLRGVPFFTTDGRVDVRVDLVRGRHEG